MYKTSTEVTTRGNDFTSAVKVLKDENTTRYNHNFAKEHTRNDDKSRQEI
ncbi:MAG: hypothetical protein KC427_10015 [Sulfurovum sp.]|nr:hypothetical protein [Sulfurovum sp.]MCO4846339.1 hypothetical protein [Sulfurovum sp.]